MKKPKHRPISRNVLRSMAVIFSANQILHLETNGLTVKKNSSNDDQNVDDAVVRIDKDIQLDIDQKDMNDVKNMVDDLEGISLKILKSVKMTKIEGEFFIEKSNTLIDVFLSSGILEKGVSPHLSFVLFLFSYFVDGRAKKQDAMFNEIVSSTLYHEILDRFEESQVFDWNAHIDSVLLALNKSVGLSIAEYKIVDGVNDEKGN